MKISLKLRSSNLHRFLNCNLATNLGQIWTQPFMQLQLLPRGTIIMKWDLIRVDFRKHFITLPELNKFLETMEVAPLLRFSHKWTTILILLLWIDRSQNKIAVLLKTCRYGCTSLTDFEIFPHESLFRNHL